MLRESRRAQRSTLQSTMQNPISKLKDDYHGGDMPLPEYAGLVALFSALLAGMMIVAATTPRRNDKALGLVDLALLGIATHKLSRIAAKDRVTSPLRAPFTRFVERGSPGEVEEESRGTGAQKAIGDLVTCPYCMSPWIATMLAFGLLKAPYLTRIICGIFSSVAISHFLHQSYAIADGAREKLEK